MRKLLTTAAVLVALIAPAAAESRHDAQGACVLGWAALSIEKGAETVDAARAAGWRHCRHIKLPVPKNEDDKEIEGDRSEHLNSVIYRMFKAHRKEHTGE